MTQLKRLIYHLKKVKINRERREFLKQKNKLDEINDRIDPFKVVIKGDHARYLTKNEPTDLTLKKSSYHYLRFKNFNFPAHKDYIPIEKTEHARKKAFIFLLIMIYIIKI